MLAGHVCGQPALMIEVSTYSPLRPSTPSSVSAAARLGPPRPMYMSWVIEGRAWPRRSATWRAVRPASSSSVATVLRKVRNVTHSKPARTRNGFQARLRMLLASPEAVRDPALVVGVRSDGQPLELHRREREAAGLLRRYGLAVRDDLDLELRPEPCRLLVRVQGPDGPDKPTRFLVRFLLLGRPRRVRERHGRLHSEYERAQRKHVPELHREARGDDRHNRHLPNWTSRAVQVGR